MPKSPNYNKAKITINSNINISSPYTYKLINNITNTTRYQNIIKVYIIINSPIINALKQNVINIIISKIIHLWKT